MTKRCTKCRRLKDADKFYASSRAPDGLQYWCKACSLEKKARDRITHPGREREYRRRTYARIMADPERHAIRREQDRQRKRRVHGITPDRYRVGRSTPPRTHIDAGPVRAAIEACGIPHRTIEFGAGLSDGSVNKVLHAASVQTDTALAILAAINILPAEIGL